MPGTGIEPVRSITSADFKSAASTNSAIPATGEHISNLYVFTDSTILSNTFGKTIAIFERTFLLITTSAEAIFPIKTLYFSHLLLNAQESLSIRNFLKILFLFFLQMYAFCHCLTNARLTWLYTFFLHNLNHLALLINLLCFLCLANQFEILTMK